MNPLKETFNWLATLAIVALCAVCWLFLLIVSPFIPDINKRAGLARAIKR